MSTTTSGAFGNPVMSGLVFGAVASYWIVKNAVKCVSCQDVIDVQISSETCENDAEQLREAVSDTDSDAVKEGISS